jgi:hypothetical protein
MLAYYHAQANSCYAAETMTPEDKLERWFLAPVKSLARLDNGDGAFAALSISLSLYERLIHSRLHAQHLSASPNDFESFAANDLGVTSDVFNKFWGMYRVGIQHFFQPKRFTSNGIRYGWQISSDYKNVPECIVDPTDHDLIHVVINPWAFAELVGQKVRGDLSLFDELPDFPSGVVTPTIGVTQSQSQSQPQAPMPNQQSPIWPTQLPPGTGNYPT